MRGGCKRLEALAHTPQIFSHNVHAVSSIPMFPPCHDSNPAILPLLGFWPGSAISSAVLMAVVDPDASRARGEGQVKRHTWKRCLRQSWGDGGVPHAVYTLYWLPLSFDYWCYLGSCMGIFRWPGPSSSPASSNLLSFVGGREEKWEPASGPDLPPGVHHLHLLEGEAFRWPYHGGSGPCIHLSVWGKIGQQRDAAPAR